MGRGTGLTILPTGVFNRMIIDNLERHDSRQVGENQPGAALVAAAARDQQPARDNFGGLT